MSTSGLTIETPHVPVHVRQNDADGPVIVMLHGSGASSAVFSRQFASSLSARYRLVAIDLPGHGRSGNADDPARTYGINGLAETVAFALDSMKIRRATFFGWSLGGHVALQLAASHPCVAGIMLTGTPPVSRGPLGLMRGFQTHWDILLASKRHFSERDVERFWHLCFGDSGDPSFLDAIRRADGQLRVQFLRSMMRGEGIDQRHLVETTSLPIGIVNGADDPFVRLPYIDSLAYAALWRERCHLVPGTGHSPFWHAFELFNPLLSAFADHCETVAAARDIGLRRSA
jgi:pimeloyl-ACP methyl ester carboxylesterase